MIQRLVDFIQGKPAVKRSNGWSKLRKEHLKLHPTCAMCGGTKKLQVHHKYPVHFFPDLELEPHNLITLCRQKKFGVDCHLLIGHLGDFKSYNNAINSLINNFTMCGFKGAKEE